MPFTLKTPHIFTTHPPGKKAIICFSNTNTTLEETCRPQTRSILRPVAANTPESLLSVQTAT